MSRLEWCAQRSRGLIEITEIPKWLIFFHLLLRSPPLDELCKQAFGILQANFGHLFNTFRTAGAKKRTWTETPNKTTQNSFKVCFSFTLALFSDVLDHVDGDADCGPSLWRPEVTPSPSESWLFLTQPSRGLKTKTEIICSAGNLIF